jgi:hypothetical protein
VGFAENPIQATGTTARGIRDTDPMWCDLFHFAIRANAKQFSDPQ